MPEESPVRRYVELGLALGRHVDGFVDSYFGPPEWADRVQAAPVRPPAELAAAADRLVADLDAGVGDDLTPARRARLRTLTVGLGTTAEQLAGAGIPYVDEVERCYGVRPRPVSEDELAECHHELDQVLGGTGPVAERLQAWRDAAVIDGDKIEPIIRSLAEDLRERTDRRFGLPDGEHVEWELVTDKPWSGFNYYLGDLQSRVAINLDLPMMSTTVAHLVAHEAYPGHHTEHARKEVGLVRRAQHLEETIFCVGTPQCTIAEGLADLGVEVISDGDPESLAASHLAAAGVSWDPDAVRRIRDAAETLSRARANAALMLHADGADPSEVKVWAERWLLMDPDRAAKLIAFTTDPTWRAYMHCYVDGLPLCRDWVGGDPVRFERLITEPLLPADLS